jgi:hypothetical protein
MDGVTYSKMTTVTTVSISNLPGTGLDGDETVSEIQNTDELEVLECHIDLARIMTKLLGPMKDSSRQYTVYLAKVSPNTNYDEASYLFCDQQPI